MSGELATQPVAAAQALRPLLGAFSATRSRDDSPALDLAARATDIIAELPMRFNVGTKAADDFIVQPSVSSPLASDSDGNVPAASNPGEVLAELDESERAILQELIDGVGGELVTKLDERLTRLR